MKKFVVIGGLAFGAIGTVLTLVVLATATSEAFPFSFDFGMMVIAAPTAVGRFLGIPNDAPRWLGVPLSLLTNGALSFLLGAYFGFLAWLVTKTITKGYDSAA